jgi:putative flippase GtrA
MNQKLDRLYEFFRFCCVGSIGFLTDYGIMELLVYHGVEIHIARVLSITVAMQAMYVLHGRVTYRNHDRSGFRTWLTFITTNLLGVSINYLLFVGALELLTYDSAWMNRFGALVIGTTVALFFNYVMNRRFAFSSENPRHD